MTAASGDIAAIAHATSPYLPREPNALFAWRTVLENVLLALQASDDTAFSLHRRMTANRHLFDRADTLLEEWGLTAIAGQPAKEISYGEQRQIDLIHIQCVSSNAHYALKAKCRLDLPLVRWLHLSSAVITGHG